MNNVEYSVEPNGPISQHATRTKALEAAARRRGHFHLEGMTRGAAYEVKAELETVVDFPLRVRGTAV